MDIDFTPHLATGAAIFGTLCMLSWPLVRGRTAMLTIQVGIGLGFALHYALIGATSGALANMLGTVQLLIALCATTSRPARMTGMALIVGMLFLPLMTSSGPASIFAAAGSVLIAFGRAQQREVTLRVVIMAGTACWLVHDLLVQSVIAFADIGSLIASLVGLWRMSVSASAASRRGLPLAATLPLN